MNISHVHLRLSLRRSSDSGTMSLRAPTIDRPRLLLVDDAPDVTLLMQTSLESEGFAVDTALDGERALEMFNDVQPLAVILDLELPGIDGFETCRRLREISDVHIIILSARGDEVDKLVGFTIGADDYLTKPASMRELAARIRSVARRKQSSDIAAKLAAGSPPHRTAMTAPPPSTAPKPPLTRARTSIADLPADTALGIDSHARMVTIGGLSIQLTRTEFALFRELAKRSNCVVSRSDLQAVVWGPEWHGGSHLVEVHMSNIRRKLGDIGAGWLIQTIREVGYKVRADITIS